MSAIETISGRRLSRLWFRRELWDVLSARLAGWSRTARTRRQLLDLTERELNDLGLTREDAYREAVRPFWDSKDLWGHRR